MTTPSSSPNRLHPFASLAALAVSLLLASCGRPGSQVVDWPEIRTLDELAAVAEGLVLAGEFDAALAIRESLVEAGRAVDPQSAPSSVRRPREVERLLADLETVVDRLSDPTLDEGAMAPLVLGLHPLVGAVMETAGMPHVHENEGPNEGYLFPLYAADGEQAGRVEIKLHDDAGDLEIWITRGAAGEPWGLPLDTVAALEFEALGRSLSLAVRDAEENADEDGVSQIRDGLTHYFVYPGETGEDASWLMGEDFAARALLAFETETGAAVGTESFILRPHVH